MPNIKPFYTLLLPALLFTSIAFGQKNFRDGYIINLQGDTIRGGIDYQEWNYNPAAIRFKDANGKITTQTPANTKAFYLKQAGNFQTYTVKLSHDVVSSSRPTAYLLDSVKTASTVFLKRMLTGKILDLYLYVDENKVRYVTVEKRNNRALELTYHVYFFNAVETSINGFRNQFATYAENYHLVNDKLIAQIENAIYDEKDIVALVNAINGETAKVETASKSKIKEPAVKVDEPKQVTAKPSFVRFFAGAALNTGHLDYTGYVDLAVDPINRNTILPQVNFGLDFSSNPEVSRLIVRLEVSAYTGSLLAESPRAKKTADMFNINFKPQLIYNFYIKDPLKVFVASGFTFNVSSYSNLNYTAAPNHIYLLEAGQQEFDDKWFSVPVKVGVVINRKVELYAAYYFPAVFETSTSLQYNASFSSFQGGLNYYFGKK